HLPAAFAADRRHRRDPARRRAAREAVFPARAPRQERAHRGEDRTPPWHRGEWPAARHRARGGTRDQRRNAADGGSPGCGHAGGRAEAVQERAPRRQGGSGRQGERKEVGVVMAKPRTLFDKIWESHLVDVQADGTCLIFIDRHIIHEITSAQAFDGLNETGRKPRHPELTLLVADHNVPTYDRAKGIAGVTNEESRVQIELLEHNAKKYGLPFIEFTDIRQGIVHIIGPEQGFTLPGTTLVCGDSHTATHGALGALAFGIGTSEVEHVLATQTLIQKPLKNMRITVNGALPPGVVAKDLILAIIAKIGTAGGTGHVIEYAGKAIRDLSMEGRMTVCNMTIEGGARGGLIAPDETTFA